ncbi:unnamed protein product [Plutella xylostella]|uniref:(diamondback moth) hypothetical protein n=1 Tax=Plutella xylostella TaxID=51655 RepID=A0A8S4E8W9_PLUXY|nr:unnamed protein product [Plutella xylostella]
MDSVMDVIKNSEEPEWLEKRVVGDLRLWQIVFLSFAGMTTLIVMVCCCFRFRIPRTKQQIEADYQRRKITSKFRHELETIQDAKMDSMSLKDALELLHEKTKSQMEAEKQEAEVAPQDNAAEAGEGVQKEQEPGSNFVKFASKVAHLSKLGAKSPTPASPTDNN